MSATLFGACSCARGRTGLNMVQTVAAMAPFDFFKPQLGGMGEYYWTPTVYTICEVTLKYKDGFEQTATFSFNTVSGALTVPQCSDADAKTVITQAVCGFGGPAHAFGSSQVKGLIPAHYDDAWWIAQGYPLPSPLPPHPPYFPEPPHAQTEELRGAYTFSEAAAAAMGLLAKGDLLNPSRLYTIPSGAQYQLGYATDVVVPGSGGISGFLTILDPSTDPVSTGQTGGYAIGGSGPINFNFPEGVATTNTYSPIFGTVHDAGGYPIPGLTLLLGGTGWAVVSKFAVFCSSPFNEVSMIEGLVTGPPTHRDAGEYVYGPQQPGDTWMNTTPANPVATPRLTSFELTAA